MAIAPTAPTAAATPANDDMLPSARELRPVVGLVVVAMLALVGAVGGLAFMLGWLARGVAA